MNSNIFLAARQDWRLPPGWREQNLNCKGWDSHLCRSFPEVPSQRILAGMILVGRLGVPPLILDSTCSHSIA